MSFILEALKKVERRKDDDAEGGVSMQGGRRWGEARRPWALRGVVFVAIAALALATLALIRSYPGEESGQTASPLEAGAAVSVREPSASSTTKAMDGEVTQSPSSSDVASLQEPADSSAPVVSPEETGTVESAEPPPGEGELGATEDLEEIDVAATPPVNLVGRGSDGAAPLEEGGGTDNLPPSELPALVLQGTSVIDGKPVAVVNYQRLFEGDYIEGARVVKISDRVVELEYKGTHFSIRL